MKKLIVLAVIVLCCGACIKKSAVKFDPMLVGTWVSNDNGIYSWFIVAPDGNTTFASTEGSESDVTGELKYSLFEKKMWINKTKFRVEQWWTGTYDGPDHLEMKDYKDRLDTLYHVNYMMRIKTGTFSSNRPITFYKVAE